MTSTDHAQNKKGGEMADLKFSPQMIRNIDIGGHLHAAGARRSAKLNWQADQAEK